MKENYGYLHISTGDLLRDVRKEDTELGKKVADLMDNGKLVTDDIVLELLKNHLSKQDKSKAFILDGFPRNINQAKELDNIFNDLDINDYQVIYLDIDYNIALKRTLGRLSCPNCKKGYNENSDNLKPKVNGICDNCGSKLIRRSDDTEDTFRIRFDTYMIETKPVLDYYRDKSKLVVIDVSQDLDSILQNIKGVI